MWMDLEIIMLCKVSNTDKVKNHMTTHIWDIKLKATEKQYKQRNRISWTQKIVQRLPVGKGGGVLKMHDDENRTDSGR